jgi:ATP-dependent DNA helicase RecG
VIDEQHRLELSSVLNYGRKCDSTTRFGNDCHSIPRTLAMSLYGDLDISVIDELREPIQTVHRFDSNRLKVWNLYEMKSV